MTRWRGVVEEYRAYLPVTGRTPVVTLHEGNTPLVPAPRLAEAIDRRLTIYLKCEGLNPTGSFKDRGMALAASKALETGARALVCVCTGHTSASAAAYAARAGLRAAVLAPRGTVTLGRLAPAVLHGATVLVVDGPVERVVALARAIAGVRPVVLADALSPARLEGQKTAAFEIVDQLGRAPDYHLLPVGHGGNLTASWRGYREYHRARRCAELPRMVGLQAAGAAALYENRPVAEPRTVAAAIRVGHPAVWSGAVEAIKDSLGWIDVVSDEEILGAYRMLAREEGVFAEPAAAATVAGLVKAVKTGRIEPDATVVLTLTGHGSRDQETARESVARPAAAPADLRTVLERLGL
ncbi:MAG TPA: threonine synthase [Candidatus Tectomicrobia bacterium]|nr:threonine synthase [Candidatus Tectomicrobia bacterium]